MARSRTSYVCAECANESPKWLGRCPSCGGWNTLEESVPELPSSTDSAGPAPAAAPIPLGEVSPEEGRPAPTGLAEVDRVLGGGLVPGSVTVLGGEPGIGKSTLLTQVASACALEGTVLYASAEESPQQVRRRAERLEAMRPRFLVTAESALPHLLDQVEAVQPDLLVVDSIQSVFDPAVGPAPGTVAQVREGAARLATEAKARSMPVVLVGHVTKEGSLAGPRVLEHLVDTVLSFEGDRHHSLRFLRAVKHRFGSTHELGVFEMTDRGLEAVDDPSGLFLSDRRPGLAGSVVVPTMQGYRPLLVEIQALTTPSGLANPRRSAQGVDSGRLALLLAVLHQRAGVSVADADVYALAVGGARVGEPAADLGIALAVASARAGVAIDADLTVCAEVGLAGELRQVGRFDRRLAEAARLGFRRAVVPYGTDGAAGITTLPARDLAEVLARLGLDAAPAMSRDRGRPPLPGPGRAVA